MKTVAVHQPNFLPYLGFFDKMRESDIFVISDQDQYIRTDFQNRNKIRIKEGSTYVNVPVHHARQPIKDIKIRTDEKIKKTPWKEYVLNLITREYKKTPFFNDFFPGLEQIILDSGESLSELNTDTINFLADSFKIDTEIIHVDEIQDYEKLKDPTSTHINTTKLVGGDIYLSGSGGKNYLDLSKFRNGVDVRFQDFKHPTYPQRYPGFVQNLSAIDALFNVGELPESGETIENNKK